MDNTIRPNLYPISTGERNLCATHHRGCDCREYNITEFIISLEAERDKLKEINNDICRDWEYEKKEKDRLRDALERILNGTVYYQDLWVQTIAKEAQGGKK
jgi:hypothetical protein